MLSSLLSAKFVILYVFILSAIYIHYRGTERFKFTRQLTDHSTLLAPLNVFVYLFSKAPATPYHDLKNYPELKLLKDNWETIKQEAQLLYQQQTINYDDIGFNSFFVLAGNVSM